MLAASLRSPGALVLDERPIPALGPRDVLLSVEATTLCGTDLRIATGQKTNGVTPGVILGHEIAARVWRVGSDLAAGVDVPAPGTQVGLAPEIACGRCAPCASGRSNVCANMRLFGTGVDGGLADLVLVPEEALACITPVAGEIAPPHLALAEPLSCCLRATRRLPIASDSRVLVLGTGPIGLIHCGLASSAGARVMACGRQARLAPARAMGAEVTTSAQGEDLVREVLAWTDGVGADVIIIAVGDTGLVPIAAQCARIGGHVSFFAGFPAGLTTQIDPNLVHYRELTLSGSANATLDDYASAVDALSSGRIDLSPLITHEYELSDVSDALDAVRTRAGLKVAVRPRGIAAL
ncbi:MAG: alcohol dehydrogenase catalytic domain-containing protein [Actinomyces sp.]|nr:alcohol dehydrogenase catalytic domain-containing protein [Actinomyces sp.]